MTLPAGFKTFVDDTVLPADDINGYLMQGIMVFDDASDRDTALVGNLREGQYAYLKSDSTTYVYNGTTWNRVGKQDVETEKNFQAFTGSGGTTVPDWATKMYYCIVRGGNGGTTGGGGAGGQVLQGNTAVTGGTSLTITVGGSGANSSLAISGGSTFTASSTGAGAGGNGTVPSAPFNVAQYGGGGANGFGGFGGTATGFATGQIGGGISWADARTDGGFVNGQSGHTNTGGGGGRVHTGTSSGGSGIVLLYFS